MRCALIRTLTALALAILSPMANSQAIPSQPAGGTPVLSLKAREINSVLYVDRDSHTDIVTQINALFAACSNHCEVHIPAGAYKSDSPVPIKMQSAAQSLVGDGSSSVSILYTGVVALSWHVTDGSFITKAGRLQGITFICTKAATHCISAGDSVGATFRDLVVYGATTGDGVELHNANQWMERSTWENVHIGSPGRENAIGLHFTAPSSSGTGSFGYQSFPGVWFNVGNGDKGVQVDAGAELYHAELLNLSFNLNNPKTGDGTELIRVGGIVTAGLCSLVGEPSTHGASGYLIGHVLASGFLHCKGSAVFYGNASVQVDGPAGTNQPRWSLLADNEIMQASSGSGSITNWNNTGTTMGVYPTTIPGSDSEENAAIGFLLGGDRFRTPFLAFDPRSFYCVHTWTIYQPIASMRPVWCTDGSGNTRQNGNAAFGGNTQLASPGINGITINGATPAIYLNATGAPSDQRVTALITGTDGVLHLQFLKDGANSGPDLMRVARTSNTSSVVTFPSGIATPTSTPASSHAPCTAGQIWSDSTYLYVCTATNTIKRAALSNF
jgi:hypothetical protein